MTIAVNVVAKGVANGNQPVTCTSNAVTTTGGSGSVFLVFCMWDDASGANFGTISDSKTNTYTIVGSEVTGNSIHSRVYKCEGGTGGSSHTFTYTNSGGTGSKYLGIAVVELTGCATSSAVDKNAQIQDTSSPFSSGATATTTAANEMLVGFGGGDSGSNPSTHAVNSASNPTSGWTIQTSAEATAGDTDAVFVTATQRVTSTGDYSFAFTESGATNGNAHIVTVKEAGGATSIVKQAAYYANMLRNR